MKIFLLLILFLGILNGDIYSQLYVSPTGNDNNPGTFQLPFRTLTKAVSLAGPDSLIYMRGGVYNDSTTHTLNRSGLADMHIKVFAYPGEIPILDFSNQPVSTNSRGIRITHNYWYIKGLVIRNAKDNGIYIQSFYNIVENGGMVRVDSLGAGSDRNFLILHTDYVNNFFDLDLVI